MLIYDKYSIQYLKLCMLILPFFTFTSSCVLSVISSVYNVGCFKYTVNLLTVSSKQLITLNYSNEK